MLCSSELCLGLFQQEKQTKDLERDSLEPEIPNVVKLKLETVKISTYMAGSSGTKKYKVHSGFPCVSFKYENDMPKNAYKLKNFNL